MWKSPPWYKNVYWIVNWETTQRFFFFFRFPFFFYSGAISLETLLYTHTFKRERFLLATHEEKKKTVKLFSHSSHRWWWLLEWCRSLCIYIHTDIRNLYSIWGQGGKNGLPSAVTPAAREGSLNCLKQLMTWTKKKRANVFLKKRHEWKEQHR